MSDEQPAVVVKDLYKSFKLPHEQHSGVKQLLVNIFKRRRGYEVQHVLDDISFEVKKGEFFGIVGRNGSGKSTLLKLLAGIYVPDKGLVQVNGSLTPFIELGVGFNPELTGRENVFLNGALLGFSRKEMEAMYDEIVEFAELSQFMDQKLKNYSSGMQVRLAFSIAVRAQSDILLIDEVLAVGDSAFQQKCFDYFEKLRAEKKTIILVTHDMSAVNRFCTNAIYIEDGKLTHSGSPEEVADAYLVDNMKSANHALETTPQEGAALALKISKQTADELDVKFTYTTTETEPMYVGISLLKDGVSIGEITTPLDMKLTGTGSVVYTLDTKVLNSGAYQISAVTSRRSNQKLIAVGRNRVNFVVTGTDLTRGAALKLLSKWREIEA